MTTQYTSILKLALPVQGELSGTWGNVVNDNITSMIEEAIAGRAVINSWTANAHTLTSADGLTSESRAAMLEFTDSGVALTGNAEVICPTASKIYIAKNAVGNSYTVTLKTSAGTGIAIPDGTTMLLFCDGTNVVEAVTNINSLSVGGYTVTLAGAVTTAAAFSTVGANALTLTTTGVTDVTLPTTGTLATLDGTETLTNKTITSPDIDGGSVDNATIGAATPNTGVFTNLTANTDLTINASTTVDGIIDDDSMGTASDTTLATSESVKAYVDSQVGANNELSEVLTNGNTTGGTNIVVTAGDSITTDSILETTAAAGVDIDGVLLKDTSVGTDDASGTDVAGTDVTVKGGAGTGTGAGGSLVFQTAPAGLTGATPNPQVTAMSIDSTGAVDMNVSLNVDGATTIDSLTITTGSTVTTILDEDDLSSDSDTALATQQSIKAYVDSQVTAQDLDFEADTGGTLSIDLDSEIQVFAGGTGIDTSGALNTVTIAIDSTVATLTDAQTLTNKTIDASLNTLSNIANASLTNSTVSYGGVQLSLGDVDATPAFDLVDATGYLGDSALVTTGALDSGSITSGFGSIDVGSSAITGGLVTAASLSVTGDLTVDTSTLKVDSANNRVGILNAAPDVSLDIGSATDAVHVPVGTTAQRPGTPAAGYFRYNADLEQFEGYTDTWGAIGGGGTNTFTFDSFTGDNSTVDFVLSQATNLEGNLIVFIDGVFQTQDAYTIATASGITTLTFSAAPATGRYIAVYTIAAGVSGNNMNLDSFSGDGATTDFTLSINAINENNTQIFIDGVYQQKDGYTVTNTTLSFSAAPPLNSTIEVMTFTQTEVNVPVDNSIEPIHIKAGDFYFDTDTLYIDSVNNRVGVGTASPTAKFYVEGDQYVVTDSGVATNGIHIASATSAVQDTYGGAISFDAGGLGASGIAAVNDSPSDSDSNGLAFFTHASGVGSADSAERMRISATGKVGIGTTSPDSPLTIDGATNNVIANVKSTDAGANIAFADDTSTAYNYTQVGALGDNLRFITSTAERMRIDSSGSVGIGTAAPYEKLTINNGTVRTSTSTVNTTFLHTNDTDDFRFGLVTALTGGAAASNRYASLSAAAYQISTDTYTNAGEALVLQPSGGNVGIGTASPSDALVVEGNVASPHRIKVSNTNASGSETLSFTQGSTVKSWVEFNNSTSNFDVWQYTNNALRFGTNNTERMRIDSSGRLLVGTTSNFGGEALQIDANSVGSTVYTAYISNTNTSTSAYNVMRWGQGAAGSATGMIGTGGSAASNAAFQNTFLVGTQSSNPLVFATADTERMRIDSSGNVGIGTASPGRILTVSDTSSSPFISIIGSASNEGGILFGDNVSDAAGQIRYNHPSNYMYFSTEGAEAMRIDSSGNLLVGITSGVSAGSEGIELRGDFGFINSARNTTAAAGHHQFFNPNGIVGNIVTAGTGTAYNTSSDARLKDSIVDAPSASDDIDAIQVRSFDWKADGSHQKYGMVAQELVTVAPEAVYQPEDPEEMMGVDYSKLVPMMLKEIQSLRARVAQLEGVN